MKDIVFLAHDPGGFDVIYPVATEMSRKDAIWVELMLAGQAAEKQPLFKKTDGEILGHLEDRITQGDDFILVTGTSWNASIELEAIQKCKAAGRKTVSILDYWCNYRERFQYKGGYVFPDFYFVMDELAYDEAASCGIDPKIMRIVGNPGLDCYVQKKALYRKKVLFISQPLSELYGGNDGYTEFDAFQGVLDACRELRILPCIKFHPKETRRMKQLYSQYSVEGRLEDIISEYDAVVGMTTMGLLQCSLMGIPVISYEPNLKTDDKCIINKLEITRGAYAYEELLEQLKMITGTIDEKSLPFWFDGRSTERCVAELEKMISDGENGNVFSGK